MEDWTQQARNVFLALGGIWTLGAVAIVLVGRAVNHRRLEREQAIESLAKKKKFETPSSTISAMASWRAMPTAF